MPREPSTPRIAVWRALKRLGVAQIGDGLVALPADARTREQLEWVAEDVEQAGGESMLWTATPDSVKDELRLAAQMAAERAAEYQAVLRDAAQVHDESDRARVVKRLRAELRRIERRDFFPPPARALARSAVEQLARGTAAPTRPGVAGGEVEGLR